MTFPDPGGDSPLLDDVFLPEKPADQVSLLSGMGRIEKTALLTSRTLGEAASLTLTRQAAEFVKGTVQECVPSLAVEAVIKA